MNWTAFLEAVILAGIWVGAISYTAFVVAYIVWARRTWWRAAAGRAVFVASAGLALLLDLTLLFRVVDVPPATALVITAAVVGFIAVGGLLKFGALAHEIARSRKP